MEVQKFKDLYSPKKGAPKKVFTFWFFIFILGQIGMLTSLLLSFLSGGGDGFDEAFRSQGGDGNFLTFEISLILSCVAHYFEREEESQGEFRLLRSTFLILGMIIVFLALLNYIFITTQLGPDEVWSRGFFIYNLLLYIAGAWVSYWMYLIFNFGLAPNLAEHQNQTREELLAQTRAIETSKQANIGGHQVKL